jgi:hypothetical protein
MLVRAPNDPFKRSWTHCQVLGRASLPLLRLQQRHFRSDCLILETHDPANFSVGPFGIPAQRPAMVRVRRDLRDFSLVPQAVGGPPR